MYNINIDSDEIQQLAQEVRDFMGGLDDYGDEEVLEAVYRCLAQKIESAKEELFMNGYRSVSSYLSKMTA